VRQEIGALCALTSAKIGGLGVFDSLQLSELVVFAMNCGRAPFMRFCLRLHIRAGQKMLPILLAD
jgi:hypothetical protein